MHLAWRSRGEAAAPFAPCASGRSAPRLLRQPVRLRTAAAAAAATPLPELQAAVEALYALRQDDATSEEALGAALAEVEQLSTSAGADRVIPELNEGRFKGYTLQGKLRNELAQGPVTLGRLSFGLYAPADLLVRLQGDDDLALVTKGDWHGRRGAYVVSTPFEVAAQPGPYEQFEGLRGLSHAIASFGQAAGNPKRLDIRFTGLRLEPVPGQDDLARWLELFRGANPAMGSDGVLEVALPEAAAPQGWLDHLVMLPGWQITQGNAGSKTLLRRQ